MQRIKKYVVILLEILMIGFIILPFLASTKYILLGKDDFSNMLDYIELTERIGSNSPIRMLLYIISERGMSFLNQYIGYLNVIVAPYSRWGYVGMQIVSSIVIILFFSSIYFFSYQVCKLFIEKEKFLVSHLGIFILLSFSMSAFCCPSENFYWITGVWGYTVAASACFISLGFNVRFHRTQKKIDLIMTCVFSIFSCGGSLTICAFCTFCNMFVVFLDWFNEKKLTLMKIVPFMVSFIFSLLSSTVPANIQRYASTGGSDTTNESRVLLALYYSIRRVILHTYSLVFHSYLLLVVICIILLGCYFKIKITQSKLHPILLGIILLGGAVIGVLPQFIGYTSPYFGGTRLEFVADVYITFFVVLFTLYTICWYNQKKEKGEIKRIYHFVFIASFIMFTINQIQDTDNQKFSEIAQTKAIVELKEGILENCRNEWLQILAEIQYSDEQDVIVVREHITKAYTTKSVGIKIDEDTWVNELVAKYYGKNSVSIVSSEGK